jgi:hypothetical protein
MTPQLGAWVVVWPANDEEPLFRIGQDLAVAA